MGKTKVIANVVQPTQQNMAKILLVEDDIQTARTIKDWLELELHTVELCHNGADGLDLLCNYSYDIVILDWELPGLSGIDVLKQLGSKQKNCSVLMLTGRSQLEEKEAGLDHGADDYLTKPFEMRELSARIRALLRRGSQSHSGKLKCRDLELDLASCVVKRAGAEIKLLPTEYALLEFFMRHQSHVFSVDVLLESVWRSDSEATVTAVRTYMTRLRKKIDIEGQAPYIETVHGFGYRMA